jgi:hypothetical protein
VKKDSSSIVLSTKFFGIIFRFSTKYNAALGRNNGKHRIYREIAVSITAFFAAALLLPTT